MPKRAAKKTAKATKAMDTAQRLCKALAKRTKSELIDVLVELAGDDRRIRRRLDVHFELETPLKELMVATRQAIADATAFDPREVNRNFDYDYAAYEAVRRNLSRLIARGRLESVMDLSLELMKKGSYQVEMSDEGLMSDDIEQCLRVVIMALKGCSLPASKVVAWCGQMLKSDRVGFICDEELRALRDRLKPSRS